MSLFPSTVIDVISKSAYWADRSIRAELASGIITGENDYTSNFTSEFRRQINAKAYPNLYAKSFVLSHGDERKIGADACIILSNGAQAKVCVFEGKWPRLSTHNDVWDNKQRSTGTSHFTSQLHRQARYSSQFAVWEMFYCEFGYYKQPAPFRNCVSTCILHSDAVLYLGMRANPDAVWSDADLINMLNGLSGKPPCVAQLIKMVCSCSLGVTIDASNVISELGELHTPMRVLSVIYGNEDQGYKTSSRPTALMG